MKMFQLFVVLFLFASAGAQAQDSASLDSASLDNVTKDSVTKTLVWPDGTRYVGGVTNGKRTGKGTIFWQDGTRFVGQFENDMRNGPGTMILPDGTVYTGFFKNDELVDTESTIAASVAASAAELDPEETAAALKGTELPMEADSLEPGSAPIAQVDEHDLIQPDNTVAVEPEPVIVMNDTITDKTVAEDNTAAQDMTDEMTAITESPEEPAESADPGDVTEVTDAVKRELTEAIDLWAAAWSEQNVPQYLASYSSDFVVPERQSRRTWEALRRTRLNRPTYISLDITYQRFELVETNIVDVFFRQAYRSNTYSDLSDKVVRLRKEGETWKILIERSR